MAEYISGRVGKDQGESDLNWNVANTASSRVACGAVRLQRGRGTGAHHCTSEPRLRRLFSYMYVCLDN